MCSMPSEDRAASQDVMTTYCLAADLFSDIVVKLSCFADDASVEFAPVAVPMNGHAEIKSYCTNAFAAVSHNAHFLSNFRVNDVDIDDRHAFLNHLLKAVFNEQISH